MAPLTRKKVIHEVEVTQTQLQSKWYTPVDGRVKIAEQADPGLVRRAGAGYHVTQVAFVPIGDRWAYHCLVEYPAGSGIIVPGTDFIDLKDPSGIAKAETSAIGRALGLHGIACEESIASVEEMERVDQRPASRETIRDADQDSASPRTATADPVGIPHASAPAYRDDSPVLPQQLTAIGKLCEAMGRARPNPPHTFGEARALIAQLSDEYSALRAPAKA